MSEENLVTVCVMARKEQAAFLDYIAKHMGVSRGVLARWVFDEARAFLLSKACLQETDLPDAIRKAA